MARIMMVANPKAANGVKTGHMFKYMGKINPMAPNTFAAQINRTMAGE